MSSGPKTKWKYLNPIGNWEGVNSETPKLLDGGTDVLFACPCFKSLQVNLTLCEMCARGRLLEKKDNLKLTGVTVIF